MNPDCEQFRERFSEYIDGELDERRRDALEAHLEGCPACREELEGWRRTLDAVGGLPRRAAPEGFADRVTARLGESGGRPQRGKVLQLWTRVLPVAAMFLLVLGLAFLVHKNGLFEHVTKPKQMAMSREVRVREEKPTEAAPPAAPRQFGEGQAGAAGGRPEAAPEPPSREETLRSVAAKALKASADRNAREPLSRPRTEEEKQLLFRPLRARTAAGLSSPDQVLTMEAESPLRLMSRALAAADEQGLRPVVSFPREGSVELYLEVPAESYGRLLGELSRIAHPERQSLRNRAGDEDRFFRAALAEYRRQLRHMSRRWKETAEGRASAPRRPVSLEAGAADATADMLGKPSLREADKAPGRRSRPVTLRVSIRTKANRQ